MKNSKKECYVKPVIFLFAVILLLSCKTPPPSTNKTVPAEKTSSVYICDMFQISYKGLPCTVFFSDGSSKEFETDEEGRITITIPPEMSVSKILYAFSGYIRSPQKYGKFLAAQDFRQVIKIKNKLNKYTELPLTGGEKVLLIVRDAK